MIGTFCSSEGGGGESQLDDPEEGTQSCATCRVWITGSERSVAHTFSGMVLR